MRCSDEVEVWTDAEPWRALPLPAPGPERDRALGFATRRDQRSFLAGRALLRRALSSRTGLAPAAWRFAPDAHGRLQVVGPTPLADLRISVSRTRELVACATAVGRDVGVDVEHVGRGNDFERLARRFFSEGEVMQLLALEGEARCARFYELWTLKEAYLKARGIGLRGGLDACAFEPLPGGRVLARIDTVRPQADPRPSEWHFEWMRVDVCHRLALAVRAGSGERLRVRHRVAADLGAFPYTGSGRRRDRDDASTAAKASRRSSG